MRIRVTLTPRFPPLCWFQSGSEAVPCRAVGHLQPSGECPPRPACERGDSGAASRATAACSVPPRRFWVGVPSPVPRPCALPWSFPCRAGLAPSRRGASALALPPPSLHFGCWGAHGSFARSAWVRLRPPVLLTCVPHPGRGPVDDKSCFACLSGARRGLLLPPDPGRLLQPGASFALRREVRLSPGRSPG